MYLGELEIILSKPSEPFQNAGEVDQLQQEISNVENRVQALEGAKKRNPDRQDDYDKVIASLTRNRESLKKRLPLAQQASVEGNRFFWNLEALGVDLPQDEEVLGWIRETGLTKD
jgi:chromosome segregation ATPase